MFSLIITIISIALVAALALATLYYGGSAFNKGSAGAEASKLINEGQQINAAVTLAKADGAPSALFADLTAGNYLSQRPATFAGSELTGTGVATSTVKVKDAVCDEVQKRATGISTAVSTSTAPTGQVYNCTRHATLADAAIFTFTY